jgi:hypothetical protein
MFRLVFMCLIVAACDGSTPSLAVDAAIDTTSVDAAPACGFRTAARGASTRTVMAAGLLGTYIVYLPAGHGALHAAKHVRVSMRDYITQVLAPLDFESLRLNIYDQLNPSIASYWTKDEVEALMRAAGLTAIHLHHRPGYSWTATGEKSR